MKNFKSDRSVEYKYLERRLFEYVSLTLFILTGFLSIQAFWNLDDAAVAIPEGFVSLAGLCLYILCKKGYFKYVRYPLIVILTSSLVYFWFAVGGYNGNMSMASAMLGVMIIVIGPKKYKLHLLVFFWVILVVLTYTQVTTTLVNPIPNNEHVRALNFTLLALVTLLVVYYLKSQYDRDRAILFVLNNDLESLNTRLIDTNEELETVITELNTTKDQLIQSEKMASVGRITAGLAHELNNPLNYVSGGIYPINNNLKEIKEVIKKASIEGLSEQFEEIDLLLNNMSVGSTKISSIIANLVKISPQNDFSDYSPFDLSLATKDSLSSFQVRNTNVNLSLEVHPDIVINGHSQEVLQAINHLLANANEASAALQNPLIKVTLYQEDTSAILEILNNGEPITQLVEDKMFDPFFTTKESEKHIGLGLYFVYSIVKKHNGNIGYSQKNEQSCFRITLPLLKR